MSALRAGILGGLAALILWGCGGPESEIVFAEPIMIPVPAGTHLQDVASAHQVSLQDLQDWNGLQEPLISDDRLLVLWKVPDPEPEDPAVEEAPAVAQAAQPRANPQRNTRPSTGGAAPKVVVDTPVLVVDSAGEGAPRISLEAPPDLRGVRSAGLLGGLSGMEGAGGLNDGLADSVAGLSGGPASAPGQAGLGARSGSLGQGGEASGLGDIGRKPQTRVEPQIPDTPIRAPRLRMPAAKRCLPPPRADQLKAEAGTLGNQGLSAAQIKGAMGGFIRHTTACIPKGTQGTYELQVEIAVGCDGRVSNVWIPYGGALPARVTDCIAQTLKHAPFPAHAVPGGVSFIYPLQYRF